MHVIRTQSVH